MQDNLMETTGTTVTPSGESHVNSLLQKQLDTFLGVPLSILGVIGNMLVILVWRRVNRMREETIRSAGVHMIWLSVVNSLLLLSFFITEVLPKLKYRLYGNLNFLRYNCYFGYPMYRSCVVASTWLMVGVMANRLVAGVYPHKAHTFNSLRGTKVTIAAITLSSIALSVPYFFADPPHAIKKMWPEVMTLCEYSGAQLLYDLWGHCIVFMAVPWTLVCGGTLLITRTILFKTRIQKHKKRGKRQTEHRTTITVLHLTFVFLVLLLFQFVGTCLWRFGFGADNPDTWSRVSAAYAVARFGVLVNAAFSFVVYCVGSSAFRKELQRMFGCCLPDYTQFGDANTNTKGKRRRGINNGRVAVDVGGSPEEEEEEEDEEEEEGEDDEVAHEDHGGNFHAVA